MKTLAIALTVALSSPALLAHGGQAVSPVGTTWTSIGSTVGPKGTATTAGASKAAKSSAKRAAAAARLSQGRMAVAAAAGGRMGSGRGASGRSGSGSGTNTAWERPGPESWEFWWAANRDAYLPLSERLAARGVTSGTIALLTGKGHSVRNRSLGRLDRTQVATLLVPSLLPLLGEHERDVVDSVELALSRMAEPDGAAPLLDALTPLLAHAELSVSSTAALSLGVLGAPGADHLLIDVAADNSRGRQLVGGGAVPHLVRQFAALGLGLIGSDEGTLSLLSLLTRLGPSDVDLRVAAALGLSQLPEDHARAPEVAAALRALLHDRRCPTLLACHVATALAKVSGHDALPELVYKLRDRDTDAPLRQSLALALGRIGRLEDARSTELLQQVLAGERDVLTRQFALLALGRIGGRDERPEDRPEQHAALEKLLGRELAGDGKSRSQRPWAALAMALYGRALPDPERRDRLTERLTLAFDEESDPSVRGAFALSLGLIDARGAVPSLRAALRRCSDERLIGHLMLTLGLLRDTESSTRMLQLCTNVGASPELRRQAATGLGLLGDGAIVPALVAYLAEADTLGECAGAASALALVGDESALDPLLELARDERAPPQRRGFAIAALGLLAERRAQTFHSELKADVNHLATTSALMELMDIL